MPLEGSQGDNITMVVHTGRLPSPTIAWYKDEEPIISDSHLEISEEPDHCQLLVKQVTPADSGTYKCVASSVLGSITKKFLLNIEGKFNVSLGSPVCEKVPNCSYGDDATLQLKNNCGTSRAKANHFSSTFI